MAGTATATTTVHRPRGVVRTEVALTCDASGVVSAVVIGAAFGRLVGIEYDGGLDASATVTLADYKTGATLVTYTTGTEGVAARLRPTSNVVTVAGAAITAATTAPNVDRDIYVGGKLTLAVSSGGVSETGTFVVIVDESGIGDLALTV